MKLQTSNIADNFHQEGVRLFSIPFYLTNTFHIYAILIEIII